MRVKSFSRNKVSVGDKFNYWTAIQPEFPQTDRNTHSVVWWVACHCQCGTYRAVKLPMLKNGHSKSCGECDRPREGRKHRETTKKGRTHLYSVWSAMKQRCGNPNSTHFRSYGGRGITVALEWLEFIPFRAWALANGYRDDLQIDRINNDGNYEPENCRWVTEGVNKRNMRQTRFVSAFGVTKCITDWASDAACGTNINTLRARFKNGWNAEMAITAPSRRGFNKRPVTTNAS